MVINPHIRGLSTHSKDSPFSGGMSLSPRKRSWGSTLAAHVSPERPPGGSMLTLRDSWGKYKARGKLPEKRTNVPWKPMVGWFRCISYWKVVPFWGTFVSFRGLDGKKCSELSPFSPVREWKSMEQQFLQGNRTWDDVIRQHSHKNEQRSWRFWSKHLVKFLASTSAISEVARNWDVPALS